MTSWRVVQQCCQTALTAISGRWYSFRPCIHLARFDVLSMASVPATLTAPRASRISLTSGGALVLGLRLATAGAMFMLQVVLARTLGVSGYGVYAFATACVQAMTVFGRAGLESTSLRQVSEYRTKNEADRLDAFLNWSRRASLVASLTAAAFLVVCTLLLIAPDDVVTRRCLMLGATALPFLTTRQIQEARLRAVHHVWQSLIGPALWPTLLAALMLFAVFGCGWNATPGGAVGLQIVALAICSLVTLALARRSPLASWGVAKGQFGVAKGQRGKGAKGRMRNVVLAESALSIFRTFLHRKPSIPASSAPLPLCRSAPLPLCSSAPLPLCSSAPLPLSPSLTRPWRTAALTFLAFDAVILLRGRTSVIIAGMLIDTDTAGIYAAAERFAEVVTLGVASINMFAAPHFAALHAADRRDELRRLVRSSQSLGLMFAIPCAVALVLFGRPLLGLLDPGFVAGYPLLLIMLASVTIGSIAGPAAYVLAMSGRERIILHGAMLCMVVNLVLSFTLAAFYGATGLAVTHLTTMIVWTIYMLWQLRMFQCGEREDVSNP